jgi:CDP-diacylglycerol--glycerol-3-phosphate 3-phosphatidyltransferase
MMDGLKRIRTPANLISLGRIAVFPIIIILAYIEYYTPGLAVKKVLTYITWLVFMVAFLTDILDGYLARSRNEVTTLGQLLDPLSDKCLVITALMMLVMLGRVPAWVAALIIIREVAVTGLRAMAQEEGFIVAASVWGKVKTITQVIALCFLLLHYPRVLFGVTIPVHQIGIVILYAAFVITLGSGYDYFRKVFKQVFAEPDKSAGPDSPA